MNPGNPGTIEESLRSPRGLLQAAITDPGKVEKDIETYTELARTRASQNADVSELMRELVERRDSLRMAQILKETFFA